MTEDIKERYHRQLRNRDLPKYKKADSYSLVLVVIGLLVACLMFVQRNQPF